MCGIVGLHGAQEDGWIQTMNAIQRHRGPDDDGIYRDREAGISLAMRRLAIIDLADGHQPMTTDDGRFTIVYNGEVYNAPELRQELVAQGIAFRTDHSDTEVLLRLFAREGAAMLPRLNGMFAFAIYDRDAGTVFCARDRFGIKPFYFTQAGGRFAFASELKSLTALPFVARDIDRDSLFHYTSLMFVPGPRTIFSQVRRLPAGHSLLLRLSDNSLTETRWWVPSFRPVHGRSQGEWAETVREGLRAAVRRWTLSDVPVGCLLSGGLDSSAIVGLLASEGQRVGTYTLGFTGPGEDKWSEFELARTVARRFGTDHHEIVLDPASLIDDLPAMTWAMDEPYGGGLPSWAVFKFMARHVKVALTGTGGDELFGNYFKFAGLEGGALRRRFGGDDPGRKRFRQSFFDACYYCTDAEKRDRILTPDISRAPDTSDLLYGHFLEAAGSLRDRAAMVDIQTQLPEEFLAMSDRFSMAHSVEARTPFLDHEFVETVLSIPAGQRLDRREYKKLLRLALRGVIPGELLDAPKRGFVIPLGLWLQGRLRPLAEDLLSEQRLKAQGLFRPSFYRDYVRPVLDGTGNRVPLVWGALMFQLWHRMAVEGGR